MSEPHIGFQWSDSSEKIELHLWCIFRKICFIRGVEKPGGRFLIVVIATEGSGTLDKEHLFHGTTDS